MRGFAVRRAATQATPSPVTTLGLASIVSSIGRRRSAPFAASHGLPAACGDPYLSGWRLGPACAYPRHTPSAQAGPAQPCPRRSPHR